MTGGFVTPHNFLGTMMMVVLVFVSSGHRTPRNRLWPFRQSSSRFWGFGCFLCAALQLKLGFHLGRALFFLPLRSCIFLSLKKGWDSRTVSVCLLVSVFGFLWAKTARNAARFTLLCLSLVSGFLVCCFSESSSLLRVFLD